MFRHQITPWRRHLSLFAITLSAIFSACSISLWTYSVAVQNDENNESWWEIAHISTFHTPGKDLEQHRHQITPNQLASSWTFASQSMLFQILLFSFLPTALGKLFQQSYGWNCSELSLKGFQVQCVAWKKLRLFINGSVNVTLLTCKNRTSEQEEQRS